MPIDFEQYAEASRFVGWYHVEFRGDLKPRSLDLKGCVCDTLGRAMALVDDTGTYYPIDNLISYRKMDA